MPVSFSAGLDVRSMRPEGGAMHLVVAIEARGGEASEPRAGGVFVLAVDVSGSMKGEPLAQVVRSVDLIASALSPVDRLGLVGFADQASLVAPPVLLDPKGKALVRARAARLVAEGNTNVEAGITLAAEAARAAAEGGAPSAGPRVVLLLSDGVPNRGATTAEALREVVQRHRPGLAVSVLGYGVDHAEDLLFAVGEAGGGGYAFVPDPVTCARAFAMALGAQADVVASGVELIVSPAEGVTVSKVVGRSGASFRREGLVVPVGDMVPGEERLVAMELAVAAPGVARFLVTVATVALRAERRGGTPAPSSPSRR